MPLCSGANGSIRRRSPYLAFFCWQKMKFDEVHSLVGHVPFISRGNARYLYDLVLRENYTKILELGIAHGTATCYMAAALEELGQGQITSVDLIETASHFQPTPEEQLLRIGLSQFVEVIRMQTGYTWFLHDNILRNTYGSVCREEYDLCIVDGPKNWTIDGAAFFFADKLLKPGGRIIFDDYLWTYLKNDKYCDATDGISHRSLSRAELETPQIKEVFELLVVQHPNYSDFELLADSSWAIAKKKSSANKSYSIIYSSSYKDIFAKVFYKVSKAIRGK
jgi:predicted O-methyltransferase YrrM